jgi:glutamine amidotransferase
VTTIVHYGAGNLRSVIRALERLGEPSIVATQPEQIARARRLILPGVGSFDAAVTGMSRSGMLPILEEKVLGEKVPILGICLGLQLFTRGSEEGTLPGLGWIPGQTRRFSPTDDQLRVPHVGWNEIHPAKDHACFREMPADACMYFVHSYYVTCDNPDHVLATSAYGQQFVSAVCSENILGVQFHPEKSAKLGLQWIGNFLKAAEGIHA